MAPTRISSPLETKSAFNRALFAQSNKRRGLAEARRRATNAVIEEVASSLSDNSLLRGLAAPDATPKALSQLKASRELLPISAEGEFIWAAGVLGAHADLISSFVLRKREFDDAFLMDDFTKCIELLGAIEREFGYSFWYIDSRIRTLQRADGLSAQKTYLQAILNKSNLRGLTAYLSFLFSYSCEDSVSLIDVTRTLDELDNTVPQDLLDYIKYQTNPFAASEAEEPHLLIANEESSPIVDRYLTFIHAVRLALVRSPDPRPRSLRTAIGLLDRIVDSELDLLRMCLRLARPPLVPARTALLIAYSKYAEGDYATANDLLETHASDSPSDASTTELQARVALYMQLDARAPALRGAIIQNLANSIGLQGNVEAATFELKRQAMITRKQPSAMQIVAYLQRSPCFGLLGNYSEIDALWALSSGLENPWHHHLLTELLDDPNIPSSATGAAVSTTAVQLHQALRASTADANVTIASLNLPHSRKALFLGHNALIKGDYTRAAQHYSEARERGRMDTQNASRYRFEALFADKQYTECLQLTREAYFDNPSSYQLFDLGKLVDKVSEITPAETSLDWLITLEIHTRHQDASKDRLLSDAHEDFLEACGVTTPSALRSVVGNLDVRCVTHFLRWISTIRNLEDMVVFRSSIEVEQERVRVLQLLSDIDGAHQPIYAQEIQQIVKSAEVERLLKRVYECRIYVDEEGAKQLIEPMIRDGFQRYKQMIELPEISFQADNIVQQLKRALKDKNNDALKNIKLPTTERESLFESIYAIAMHSFFLSPECGLDTYLSTRIRHGAIEGELRSSLSKRGLLPVGSAREIEHAARASWPLSTLSDQRWTSIATALSTFSMTVSAHIRCVKDDLVRIEDRGHPSGMFSLRIEQEGWKQVMRKIDPATNYVEFVDLLFSHFWSMVGEDLSRIRGHLTGELQAQIVSALDALSAALGKTGERSEIRDILDTISLVRAEVLADIQRVCSWFRLPAPADDTPHSIDVAVQVATKMIRTCYPQLTIEPQVYLMFDRKLVGWALPSVVDILSICLDNAVKHSGITGRCPFISIRIGSVGDLLQLEVTNEISETTDLAALASDLAERLQIAKSSAAALAQEGGSGFGKILRIMSRDLNVERSFDVTLVDCKVSATVNIQISELIACGS